MEHLLDLSLEELMDTKISGPTRTPMSLPDVPASVTVFNRSEIQKLGIDFLYELLNYVPGFQTSRDNDYSTAYLFSSRGSDTGQGTTAIQLLVDGTPRQEIRSGSASALSSRLPVDRIERIEVIRGPGSALYGSGAFLGVINIVTVSGANSVKVQGGENDRHDMQTQLSTAAGPWQFDAYVSRYEDHGQDYALDDRFVTTPVPTSDPQLNENVALGIGYNDDTRLRLEHLNLESEDFYSIGAINNGLNEHRHYLNTASLEHSFHWYRIDSQLRVSVSENRLNFIAQGTAPGRLADISNPSSTDPLIGDVLYQTHEVLTQWLNDLHVNASTSVQFGAEKRHEHIETAQVLANFDSLALANRNYPIRYSPDRDIYNRTTDTVSREILGLYAQIQQQLNAQTTLTLGARYDDYLHYYDNTSYRVAMIRTLNDTHSLKLFYGTAFRAPSLMQLDSTESITIAPSPDLKPENIQTTELVWLAQASRFSLSVSAFYNVIDDRIDASGFVNGRKTNVNRDQEDSSGLELETSFQLSPNWLVRASLTDFLAMPESSFRESKHLASLIINYQRENWWANLAGYYNSEREMPAPNGTIDGYSSLNLKTGYLFTPQLNGFFQIKNLLDNDVASAAQNPSIVTPVPYRGREASIGLRLDF